MKNRPFPQDRGTLFIRKKVEDLRLSSLRPGLYQGCGNKDTARLDERGATSYKIGLSQRLVNQHVRGEATKRGKGAKKTRKSKSRAKGWGGCCLT